MFGNSYAYFYIYSIELQIFKTKNMSTKTDNGKGTKVDASQPKDTANGATIMQAVTENTALPVPPVNPVAEKLKKIHAYHALTEKRKKLVEMQDTVQDFETSMDGETDTIDLTTQASNSTIEVRKPDAVKKVLKVLKEDLEAALNETDAQLLAATL